MEQDQVKKVRLRPWLNNANKGVTFSNQILRELRRVKILSCQKEGFIVKRTDLVTKKQIHAFEQQIKPRARFVDGKTTGRLQLFKNTPG